ncbi:wax ester synthase/diacylglycerol acyltransferase 11-like isoform X2 [Amaranthus tricolor]|uniref:wax ester synthase/diacylglycerol acyltransferase 11-like isoform X2 n=1 Tax=Amaranthus tricolor TaxID=29722 RepID=UPI0025874CB5|nr:wax ester synthase/diacylglycerol acyltransferase 11-like isoform X2 [Amaranthus tricolor]
MSKSSEMKNEEVLNSPFSRVYLCPETDQVINCAMGLKHPIDVEALKKAFSNSIILNHPRFCSLIVQNPNGTHQWKRTHVNIDDHFIIYNTTPETKSRDDKEDEESAVNAYLADMAVSSPLSKNKPLWEVHVLLGLKCIVLRVHHALGDGVSLMSMLSTCFGQKKMNGVDGGKDVKNEDCEKRKWKGGLWGIMKSLWFTIVFGLRLLGRVLWVKDEFTIVSGGDGVELWPRKLVTAKFNIRDLKSIKTVIPNATVNDVIMGIICSGLSIFIDAKSAQDLKQRIHLTSILVVNLRQNPFLQIQENISSYSKKESSSCGFSLWGNKFGLVLLPAYCCCGLSSLDQVRTIKAIMDKKKLSYEAHIIYSSLQLLTSFLGPKHFIRRRG